MTDDAKTTPADLPEDWTVTRLSPEAWAKFKAIIDSPPEPKEALKRLMTSAPPWEQPT